MEKKKGLALLLEERHVGALSIGIFEDQNSMKNVKYELTNQYPSISLIFKNISENFNICGAIAYENEQSRFEIREKFMEKYIGGILSKQKTNMLDSNLEIDLISFPSSFKDSVHDAFHNYFSKL